MEQISIINSIEVPTGMENQAIKVRDEYVEYFRQQAGFVSSTFYRSINEENKFNFINIVVWESYDAYSAVVNSAALDNAGENNDGMKVLGNGFPEPIAVSPGQYKMIG